MISKEEAKDRVQRWMNAGGLVMVTKASMALDNYPKFTTIKLFYTMPSILPGGHYEERVADTFITEFDYSGTL